MLHKRRRWGLPTKVDSPEELAELLTERSWTLCSAFEHEGYLYLNDSTSEDSAVEYAVVKPLPDGRFLQVESITFSWCTPKRALELIGDISAGNREHEAWAIAPEIDISPHQTCEHCA